ncbi:MAG: hypothetical protein RR063_07090 [Anaerovoracaceae bacterium]
MKLIQDMIFEHYIWVASTTITLFVAFIWILIISGKHKKRFLIWKKERINLWIYSNEREYSKDDLMQELYDENIRLEKENKILKRKVSDSSLWGIIVLCVVIIAMWVKRSKNNKNEPDDDALKTSTDNDDEITLIEK